MQREPQIALFLLIAPGVIEAGKPLLPRRPLVQETRLDKQFLQSVRLGQRAERVIGGALPPPGS